MEFREDANYLFVFRLTANESIAISKTQIIFAKDRIHFMVTGSCQKSSSF